MRLRQLLETSLGVAFYAFIPSLLFPVIGSTYTTWRISNAILGVAHAVTLFVSIHRARALGGAVVGRKGATLQLMRAGGLTTIVLNFAAALDVIPWQSSVYMLGLLYLLFIASHTFVRLLLANEGEPAKAPAPHPVVPAAETTTRAPAVQS